MIELHDVEQACQAGESAKSLVGWFASVVMSLIRSKLSVPQRLLLGSCAGHGIVQLVPGGEQNAIAINGNAIDSKDRLTQTTYLEALVQLCKRGYFSFDDGLLRPTVKGHKAADKFRKQGYTLFP